MALRVGLLLLILAFAAVADSSFSFNDASLATIARFDLDSIGSHHISEDDEMMMSSETARRVLNQQRYISYGAMKSNRVPCNRRGRSYYNCNQRGRANPYRRGCSAITRCARSTG